jgi:hypothetical protein
MYPTAAVIDAATPNPFNLYILPPPLYLSLRARTKALVRLVSFTGDSERLNLHAREAMLSCLEADSDGTSGPRIPTALLP